MKKKLFCLLLPLLLLYCLAMTAAAENPNRVVDMADLLTDSEEQALNAQLREISERQQMDVVVVTVDSTDGKTPMEYADDYFDYNGYGYGESRDGVLLLISMEERDWWVTTTGRGEKAVDGAGLDEIEEDMLSDLSAGRYADAFRAYAERCDRLIDGLGFNWPLSILISLAVGLIAALIATGSMKKQLRSVAPQPYAGNYTRPGSMNLTKSSDLFLYRHVTRTARPKESSSGRSGGGHYSSSGSHHGGGGGKF